LYKFSPLPSRRELFVVVVVDASGEGFGGDVVVGWRNLQFLRLHFAPKLHFFFLVVVLLAVVLLTAPVPGVEEDESSGPVSIFFSFAVCDASNCFLR